MDALHVFAGVVAGRNAEVLAKVFDHLLHGSARSIVARSGEVMFMRSVTRSVLAVAVLLAAIGAPALAAEVSVGQFVQELARAKKLNATDARIAADSLAAVGVRLPAELKLSERLTEADVVQISRAAGLLVSTTNPAAPFDEDQMDQFFVVFGAELESTPPGDPIVEPHTPDFDPFSKGKGNHWGHYKGGRSPSEPE